MQKRLTNVALSVAFAFVLFVFLLHPQEYMQCFFDGLTVWAHNILPAIFPFALLTTLYTKALGGSKFSVTKFLFGIDCDRQFLASVLCGYPIGAKAIAESHANSQCATAMSSFCSTAGPIFMIVTIGAKMLKNATATAIVIISQVIAMFVNGKVWTAKRHFDPFPQKVDNVDFGNSLTSSVLSILCVGGLVALFFMLTAIIQSVLPSAVANSPLLYFGVGLLEMTNGILGICSVCEIKSATVLISALLSFGGLCVFLQCYAFLALKNVKATALLKMKATQSAFATLISFVLVQVFL